MKTVVIIQARMGSTRLPGKVLMDIAGQPMIDRVVQRAAKANLIDQVLVATSNLVVDQPLRQHCERQGWSVFAGDEQDVLSRYFWAAKDVHADRIVRITADCPLVDAGVIDRVVEELGQNRELDLVSNVWPNRTFPRGLDVEAFTMSTLSELHQKCNLGRFREHVTLAAYQLPARFRIGSVTTNDDWSSHRWTVDTADDLKLVRQIYHFFQSRDFVCSDYFSLGEVQSVFRHHPHWFEINRHVEQKAA